MQDLFNELWLVDAPLKTKYTVERLDWYEAPDPAPNGPGPLVTICLRLTSHHVAVRFDIQAAVYSLDDTVHIGNSDLLDPKTIIMHDRIHIFADATVPDT